MGIQQTLIQEKQRFIGAFKLPVLLAMLMWIVHIISSITGISLVQFGIFPRTLWGLAGLLFSPFIHADWTHLISNTLPFIILSFLLIYSYNSIKNQVMSILYLGSGILTWLIGRQSYHIGASGMIYGLAFFIFFSGIFRKDIRSMALALLVVVLYGGIVWGLLPLETQMSFEGHIAGAISGVAAAYTYRNYNKVQPKKYAWQNENTAENPFNVKAEPYWKPRILDIQAIDNEQNTLENENKPEAQEPPKLSTDSILDWEIKYHHVSKNKKLGEQEQ